MVGPTVNQQTKPGIPTESRPALIHQGATEFVFSQNFFQFCSPVEKFNKVFSDNSMSNAGMELFVHAAPVLVNAPKRDQVPASF